jgi:hypothetical protein
MLPPRPPEYVACRGGLCGGQLVGLHSTQSLAFDKGVGSSELPQQSHSSSDEQSCWSEHPQSISGSVGMQQLVGGPSSGTSGQVGGFGQGLPEDEALEEYELKELNIELLGAELPELNGELLGSELPELNGELLEADEMLDLDDEPLELDGAMLELDAELPERDEEDPLELEPLDGDEEGDTELDEKLLPEVTDGIPAGIPIPPFKC